MSAFDFSAPPFDLLDSTGREKILRAGDITYFRPGERLTTPDMAPDHLFVIMKGMVAEYDGDTLLTVHGPGDCVGAMALIRGRASPVCEAREETLAYTLPRQLLLDLCRNNLPFERYFTASVSERLLARAEARTTRGMTAFMVAKVGDAYLHPPVFADGRTGLRDAALMMKQSRSTSLLIKNADGRIGILSGSDIRDAVLVNEKPLDTPVEQCASFGTITIRADDFLFNAQVMMTKHGVRRLPVLHDGHIIGVLELIDLLSYMSSHSHLVAIQIERADSVDGLGKAAASFDPLLRGLHGSGVKVRFIAELVSDLSRKLQRRLFQFLADPALEANSCLIVMGSEGRGEQMARTDQDNALVVSDDIDPDGLRPLCQQFTEAMIRFGWPPCPGNIMVSNPDWCKTGSAFRDDLLRWVDQPDENSFLNLAAFLDAQPVAGSPLLLHRLKERLFERVSNSDMFVSHFAKPVLWFDTPGGGLWQALLKESGRKDPVDIKKAGIFPIVHGVRALALQNRIMTTNTFDRIDALRDTGRLDRNLADELVEALQFLMELRLGSSIVQAGTDISGTDTLVEPDTLGKLQYDALRDSFAIVRRFRGHLTTRLHLDAF